MVRNRLGDWRSVWRFALAGLLAGFLVVATSQTTVVAPLFFALQDQLFPVPTPSEQVTLVALADYVAVDLVPGLQLKGKSATTFHIYDVTAIREDPSSPWVPFPSDSVTASYDAIRRHFTMPSIFPAEPRSEAGT